MGQPDGVPCQPGNMIRSQDGTWWECKSDGTVYESMIVPVCREGQVLTYRSGGFEGWDCVGPARNDTMILWIMGVGLALTIAGILGMGLTQWWRNRKAQPKEVVPEINWESLLGTPGATIPVEKNTKPDNIVVFSAEPVVSPPANVTNELGVQMRQPKSLAVFTSGDPEPHGVSPSDELLFNPYLLIKEPTVDPKQINELQNDLRDIYMELQMARGEINKLPGLIQIYVNSAMKHLDTARDKSTALGEKIK